MPHSSVPAQPLELTHLLYLHGFRSSPRSTKAQQTLQWFAEHHPHVHVEVPQLPLSPKDAAQLMQGIVNNWPQVSMAVIGSSLGGYYASWVADQCHCPAVFLNPAVHPARDLEKYIGETTAWHSPEEKLYFKPEYVDQLTEMAVDPQPEPKAPQLALIAKGDEVLDWREMVIRYPYARQIVLEGGDHALSDAYERHLPDIARFLFSLGRE